MKILKKTFEVLIDILALIICIMFVLCFVFGFYFLVSNGFE